MTKTTYNVLIVGAGDIGSGFDNPNSTEVLTHAHAFVKHEGFNLIGFVEPNKGVALNAAKKWSTSTFTTMKEAFSENEIDIVSVAAPDKYHFEILTEIATFKPKFVLAEKPLTNTIDEAREILSLFNNEKIAALVNYKRRFIPEILKLKEKLDNKCFGDFIYGTSYYGKGLNHNGSHLIDLLIYFLDNNWDNIVLLDQVNDFEKEDPSYSVILSDCHKNSLLIKAIDCRHFTTFEIDLIFKKGRVRITELGLEIEESIVKKNEIFTSFNTLQKTKTEKTQLNNSLLFTVDHIYNYLIKGTKLVCSIEETIKGMELINKIKNKK